jgi:hypothetical protein
LGEGGSVLTVVKDAARGMHRSPSALFIHLGARCHETLGPGRENAVSAELENGIKVQMREMTNAGG